MDLKHPPTTTIVAANSPTTDGETEPEIETETPLHSHLIKPFSTFNKNNHHHQNHHHQQVVAYKECLKNHAATIGSHALDGCGEYMPTLTTNPHEPTSLKCAACGCHRNFHRREHIINEVYNTYAPHVLLSFNAADHHQKIENPNPNGRKRYRTKFSQDQKEKMHLFAEKVGWKMQRCDDKVVMDFCNEVGIKRGIFKVWMHNNKNTFGKIKDNNNNINNKETSTSPASPATGEKCGGDGGVKSVDIYDNGRVVNSSDDKENGGGGGENGGGHLHVSNNGSCSSS